MKNKLINSLTGNIPLKLIAVVIAFVIWLLVSNTNNPTQTRTYSNVPITIVNQSSIADIGKVVEPQGNGTVTLRVRERRRILEQLTRNDFYVEADMENINDTNSVPLTAACTNAQVSWDEIDILPTSLKVTLEDKVEQTFAVSVSTSGSPAKGFEVGGTELVQGRNIYIAGPQSTMQIINQVVAPVNVSGINEDMTLTASLKVYDKNGSDMQDKLGTLEFKDSTGSVLTDGVVQVAVDLWKVKTDISMNVETTGSPAAGYQIAQIETIPASISLAGTDEALRDLGSRLTLTDKISVSGASEDISQEIDLTDTLSEMEGLALVNDTDPTVMVNIHIEKTGDVTINVPLGSAALLNKPENTNLVFTPADKIAIAVRSVDGEQPNLTPEDVRVSIDLTPCREDGSHELNVEVELPEGYELASAVTIMVNSERLQEESEEETE